MENSGSYEASRIRGTGVLVSLAVVMGCAGGRGGPAAIGPAVDGSAVALAAEAANRLPRTARIDFEWTLREPNLNVSGAGVARVQPPDRARLDLFLGEGSSVLAVALVGDSLLTPRGAPRTVIPSSPMLWASFGVFWPGDDSVMLGADRLSDSEVRLRYLLATGHELHYLIRDDRIYGVDLLEDGSVAHHVDLELAGPDELPLSSTYRNIAAFRELKVTVRGMEDVDTHPVSIWRPGR